MAYSFAQLEAFAIQGGFPANLAPTMAAIAMAESSGINQIQKGEPYKRTGWGLWQITPGNSVPEFGIDHALLNPVNNAKAAFRKWQWQGLRAWTTYTNGAYKRFLPANAPPPANDGSSGDVGTGTGSGPTATVTPADWLSDVTGLTALGNTFKHIFDVAANNTAYALVVGAGAAMMGIGVVLMVLEGPSHGAAAVAGKVGKLVRR